MIDLAALPPALAIDGGTSTTRARLIERGRVVAEARRPVGVRDNVLAGGSSPVVEAVRACLDELEAAHRGARSVPIVAAGMLSSEVGLAFVPHVAAPAGLAELAEGATPRVVSGVTGRPILFIPGVKTLPGDGPDGWAVADVMRGEECETLGAMLALAIEGPAAFVWPGSHTKLVLVDEGGRIVGSRTTLAGEIAAALARHTLLAKSLPAVSLQPNSVELVVRGRAITLGRRGDITLGSAS